MKGSLKTSGIGYSTKVRHFRKTADFVLNVRTAAQGVPPAEALDRVQGKIVPLGQRFHGSESSFPFSSYIDTVTSTVSDSRA
jgi:hypothetical protein